MSRLGPSSSLILRTNGEKEEGNTRSPQPGVDVMSAGTMGPPDGEPSSDTPVRSVGRPACPGGMSVTASPSSRERKEVRGCFVSMLKFVPLPEERVLSTQKRAALKAAALCLQKCPRPPLFDASFSLSPSPGLGLMGDNRTPV